MSDAIAAHGTLVAYEADPAGSPATFDTIAELADIVPPALQRPSTEVTPHNDGIDAYVVGRKGRGEMTLELNFLHTNATHDESTGLIKHWIDGTKFGIQTTFKDAGVWIMSGFVTNMAPATPAREGAQTAAVTLRPTGAMKIESTTIS